MMMMIIMIIKNDWLVRRWDSGMSQKRLFWQIRVELSSENIYQCRSTRIFSTQIITNCV